MEPTIEQWDALMSRKGYSGSPEAGLQETQWRDIAAAAARWVQQNAGALSHAELGVSGPGPLWAKARTETRERNAAIVDNSGPAGGRQGFVNHSITTGETPESARLNADLVFGSEHILEAVRPYLNPSVTDPMSIPGFRAVATSPRFEEFLHSVQDGRWDTNALAETVMLSRTQDSGRNRLEWMGTLTPSYETGLQEREELLGRMTAAAGGDGDALREVLLERQTDRDRVDELRHTAVPPVGWMDDEAKVDVEHLHELTTAVAKWEGLDLVISEAAKEFDAGISPALALPALSEVASEREYFTGTPSPAWDVLGRGTEYEFARDFERQAAAAATGYTELANPTDAQSRVAQLARVGADLRKQAAGEVSARTTLLERLDAALVGYQPSTSAAAPAPVTAPQL